jgi:hypothetical protein
MEGLMDSQRGKPAALPDVATAPHAAVHPPGDVPPAGEDLLQDTLREIREVAQKVGGFKRLAEIASELDRAGAGQ